MSGMIEANEVFLNKVTLGDCMYYLEDIEDESIDLVILDPDYNDWDRLCEEGLICQAVRVLKPTGNIICFTKQPFDLNLRNEVDYMFRREICWTFENGGAWVSNKMPLVSFQKIYWLAPTKTFFFNPRTGIPYNSKTKKFKRSKKVFGGYEAQGKDFTLSENGVWMRDHYHFNKPQTGSTPSKPTELINILLRCFCPKGGVILNPFSGSGAVEKAAIAQGMNFIGFENNPEVFKKFELSEIKTQLNLF